MRHRCRRKRSLPRSLASSAVRCATVIADSSASFAPTPTPPSPAASSRSLPLPPPKWPRGVSRGVSPTPRGVEEEEADADALVAVRSAWRRIAAIQAASEPPLRAGCVSICAVVPAAASVFVRLYKPTWQRRLETVGARGGGGGGGGGGCTRRRRYARPSVIARVRLRRGSLARRVIKPLLRRC
jgi:hypothetical protein